jgi:protein-disulfide isomerase
MRLSKLSLLWAATLAVAGTSPLQAAPAKPVAKAAPKAPTSPAVAVSPTGGHVLGRANAPHKLVEYMSYTCPHCAHFDAEASAPLQLGPIAQGKLSFEVRHLLRDPLDVTMAVLTNCAPPARFFPLHHKFLADQNKWMGVVQAMTEAQMQRWNNGPMLERMRAIAGDLKFYDTAASFGVSRPQADACFANEALIKRIVQQTRDAQTIGVDSTPSFTLDGDLMKDAHDWASVQAQLGKALK